MTSKVDEIKSTYEKSHSVKRTAKLCKVSTCVVIKVLITIGVYPTDRTKEITRLRLMGMSTGEIAEYLNVQPRTVKRYYPYVRGTYSEYTERKSENARKIAEWRRQKKEGAMEDAPSGNLCARSDCAASDSSREHPLA